MPDVDRIINLEGQVGDLEVTVIDLERALRSILECGDGEMAKVREIATAALPHATEGS